MSKQAGHIDALRGAMKNIVAAETLDNAKSIAKTALDFAALLLIEIPFDTNTVSVSVQSRVSSATDSRQVLPEVERLRTENDVLYETLRQLKAIDTKTCVRVTQALHKVQDEKEQKSAEQGRAQGGQ